MGGGFFFVSSFFFLPSIALKSDIIQFGRFSDVTRRVITNNGEGGRGRGRGHFPHHSGHSFHRRANDALGQFSLWNCTIYLSKTQNIDSLYREKKTIPMALYPSYRNVFELMHPILAQ